MSLGVWWGGEYANQFSCKIKLSWVNPISHGMSDTIIVTGGGVFRTPKLFSANLDPGCHFPHEPVNFVHRKFSMSQELVIRDICSKIKLSECYCVDDTWKVCQYGYCIQITKNWIEFKAKFHENLTGNMLYHTAIRRKPRKKWHPVWTSVRTHGTVIDKFIVKGVHQWSCWKKFRGYPKNRPS